MSEYLAPGVFVEEVRFQPSQIQPASTSVAGMVGPARFGPAGVAPQLLTSFNDFQTYFGDAEDLAFSDGSMPNYSAYAAQTFFDNGGQQLYFARVYNNVANAPWGSKSLPSTGFAGGADGGERHHFTANAQGSISRRGRQSRCGPDATPLAHSAEIRHTHRHAHTRRLHAPSHKPTVDHRGAAGDEPACRSGSNSEPDGDCHICAGDHNDAGHAGPI
jgi:hypothetical protein